VPTTVEEITAGEAVVVEEDIDDEDAVDELEEEEVVCTDPSVQQLLTVISNRTEQAVS